MGVYTTANTHVPVAMFSSNARYVLVLGHSLPDWGDLLFLLAAPWHLGRASRTSGRTGAVGRSPGPEPAEAMEAVGRSQEAVGRSQEAAGRSQDGAAQLGSIPTAAAKASGAARPVEVAEVARAEVASPAEVAAAQLGSIPLATAGEVAAAEVARGPARARCR